jgi:hypothetical protein
MADAATPAFFVAMYMYVVKISFSIPETSQDFCGFFYYDLTVMATEAEGVFGSFKGVVDFRTILVLQEPGIKRAMDLVASNAVCILYRSMLEWGLKKFFFHVYDGASFFAFQFLVMTFQAEILGGSAEQAGEVTCMRVVTV